MKKNMIAGLALITLISVNKYILFNQSKIPKKREKIEGEKKGDRVPRVAPRAQAQFLLRGKIEEKVVRG